MSLRKAALVAAAGFLVDIVIALYYTFSYSGIANETLLVSASYASQVLMAIVFVLLYREQRGTGEPRRRQDVAVAATIVNGILLHIAVTRSHPAELHTLARTANWALDTILLPVCWLVFLILLVKDADPWRTRPMRTLAPLLTILTAIAACRGGYFLFFRVGLAWLNLATQRSLSALFWNLLLLPLLELFRSLSVVIFSAVLWRYSWVAAGRKSQIAGSS